VTGGRTPAANACAGRDVSVAALTNTTATKNRAIIRMNASSYVGKAGEAKGSGTPIFPFSPP